MPEIHNPHLSQNSSAEGAVLPALTVIALVLVLMFGYQFAAQHQTSSAPVRTQTHSAVALTRSPGAGGSVEQARNFGWLTFIAWPLYQALRFLHDHIVGNWGWSIVVLTVIVNLLILWPRMAAMKSSLKMMRVQPRAKALRERLAGLQFNDPRRADLNAEMMALYKAEGANMYGGCLPTLLQMPLLFAYFSVLRNAPELHHAGWLWLSDLSLPDPLHVLPLLIIGSMALTQFVTPAPGMSPSQRRMAGLLMPAAMGFFLWHYAAGISLYWVTGNLINLVVQLALNRTSTGREMHALAAPRAS